MVLSKVAIQRPILTTVMIIAIVMMGIFAYLKMPLNTMPDVSIPVITIQVIYPGAGPEEIENNITKYIEDEVSTISGLDYVESYVMENVNLTVCRFDMDKDVDIANQEIKDKVDAISNRFPTDADNAVIMKFDINAKAVMSVSLLSPLSPKKAYDFVDTKVKDKFTRISGVSKVDISGGLKREIHIVLDKNNLLKYNLSPLQVIGFIGMNNLNIPGGNITRNGSEYSVKVEGEFKSLEEIEDIRFPTSMGYRSLKDIANIVDGQEKASKVANFYNLEDRSKTIQKNGAVINIAIFKQSDANTVEVARLINNEIDKLNENFPINTKIEIGKDDSVFIKNSVDDTLNTIYLGILLTALVLYIFLHSFKTTLIIAVSMPITLISTFLLADFAGFSLNVMSLMALSVSVGTLVTNSVIILENIDRYINMGMNKKEAADKGTAEIAVAVIASTLTNIVVFVPIASMESIVGQFFVEFGLMVTFAMIFSLIIGFTVTPMLSALILSDKSKKKKKKSNYKGFAYFFDKVFDFITENYKKSLAQILKSKLNRFLVISFAIVILVVSFKVVVPNIGSEFMPFVDDGDIEVTIEMPTFYSLDRTAILFDEIETKLIEHTEVVKIISDLGKLGNSDGANLGAIKIKLADKGKRDISTNGFVNVLNREFSSYAGAKIKVAAISSFSGGGGGQSPIDIQIFGKDINILKDLTEQVYDIAIDIKGTLNMDTDIRPGKPEIKILPKRNKIADYNTSVKDIAQTIRSNIEGITASKYKENGEEYDVIVKLAEEDINDVDKINNLLVLTPKGNIKISELAEIKFSTSPTKITRKNKLRMYKVTGSLDGSRTSGVVVDDIFKEIDAKIKIPDGYEIKAGGDVEMQKEMGIDFAKAGFLAIVLTFLLIAGLLESFLQSIFIMATLPLSIIGILWSLYLTGESMNLFSMMAGIMLIGIVVNNAILILDYANQLVNLGKDRVSAIIEASPLKLKAIAMATLASIFGMLPLALGFGDGAEMRQGMGIVSIGGLVVSAALTLYIIPVLYSFLGNKAIKKEKNG